MNKTTKINPAKLLDLANHGLVIVIVGLAVQVLWAYCAARPKPAPPFKGEEGLPEEAPVESAFQHPKPFSAYEQHLAARDLFRPLGRRADKRSSSLLEKAIPALHQRVKLIGILLDHDSKAIVEDRQDHQTLFLSSGEKVGPALLEDIREDRVIFLYNNKRVEMTP